MIKELDQGLGKRKNIVVNDAAPSQIKQIIIITSTGLLRLVILLVFFCSSNLQTPNMVPEW